MFAMMRRSTAARATMLIARSRLMATAAASEESTTTRRIGAVFFSSVVGLTGCLTAWQLQRYQWKVKLIADRTAVLEDTPQPLRTVVSDPAAGCTPDQEYRRIILHGEFDHTQQMCVGPRSAPPAMTTEKAPPGATNTSGWDILTPLNCSDGSRVIVNRGWVPRDAYAAGAVEQPTGQQSVEGVLKGGDRPNKYARNTPAEQRYVWLDLSTIAAETGSAPLLVVASGDESDAKRWPRKRPLASFVDFHVEPR